MAEYEASTSTSRYFALIWAVFVGIVIVIWGSQHNALNPYDDAYITYRYADNFRHGLGLVYNPGEWVLGTTAPLYALLLGVLGVLIEPLDLLGHWVGIFSWVVVAWVGMALLWREERRTAALIFPLFILLHPALPESLGMETPLVVALMLLSAYFWLGGRTIAAVICLAALILTRQDGALWAIFLGLEITRRKGKLPVREAIFTTLLTAPWFFYAWQSYGTILPNSAAAKIGQTDGMALGGETAAVSQFLRDFVRIASVNQSVVLILLGALLLVGVINCFKGKQKQYWLIGWFVAYLSVYTAMGVISFPWYFVPPLTILWLLVALGVDSLALQPRLWTGAKWGAGLVCAGFFALAAWHAWRVPPPKFNPDYKPAALWLAQNSPESATVAAVEIGVIGYFSNRPIIDSMGLVTPGMTDHLFGWQETVVYATQRYQPDYVIVPVETAWQWMALNWWFQADYEQAASFGSVGVYARKSAEKPHTTIPTDLAYETGVTLTQIDLLTTTIGSDQMLDLYLHLLVTADQTEEWAFTVFLNDVQTFERIAPASITPFDGGYRTQFWRRGDQFVLPVRLPLPPEISAGTYQVGVEAVNQSHFAGWLQAGDPPLIPLESPFNLLWGRSDWHNGIYLESVAYGASVRAGEGLPVQVRMGTIRPIERNLTRFIHVIDAGGTIISQSDERPVAGRWPTPIWQPEQPIWDTTWVAIPAGTPAGTYGLRIGWYDETGRLLLRNGQEFVTLPDVVRIDE